MRKCLCCYHNKLLMQWKGPFEVSSVVGLNDYKVKVKGKEKVYHANLLKKYFEREETTVEGAVAVGAGATSIDDTADCAAKVDKAEEVMSNTAALLRTVKSS